MRTKDPETGYIGEMCLGQDYGPEVRCKRCGGRGMWSLPINKPLNPERVLCLGCGDDWFYMSGELLAKHGWKDMRSSRKKRDAAFEEFLRTRPREVDIGTHNHAIETRDRVIHSMAPQFFKKYGDER